MQAALTDKPSTDRPARNIPPTVQGLEGVVASATRLSQVDGEAGELTLAGFPLAELAGRASFEEVVHLLWHDRLPRTAELTDLRRQLVSRRELPEPTLELLRHAARVGASAMDALRMAAGTLSLGRATEDPQEAALTLVASFPTIVGSYWRLLQGQEPLPPRDDLGHAASYLYQLTGEAPSEERIRGLEIYLLTVADHGFNASTFTARVVVSTDSDLVSAIAGAVGTLKGPLHGGAPGPALDMVLEIGEAERAEEYLRAKLARGERLMGFGHRVYRVRDPRADVLAVAAERFYAKEGDGDLYQLAMAVEKVALGLLREHKPGRRLDTNVEYYTALLLLGLGLPNALFTPTFAVSRVAGWTAHALEQLGEGRLIRPRSAYVGDTDRRWVPIEER
ncbi:MAG: citrate synthase/methylcitrate synthase [Acidobacteriota bacterium]